MTDTEANRIKAAFYSRSMPSPKNALDLFEGRWTSRLPSPFSGLSAGSLPLFDDPRIGWFIEQFGSIQGMGVLELGPLEGGHTWMLEQAGAAGILAIEGNSQAYLRCLVVKEILSMQRSRFVFGDFLPYLRSTEDSFSLGLASGVLYHMENPAELLSLLSRTVERLCLWTQYFDEPLITDQPHIAGRFGPAVRKVFDGFEHTLHSMTYSLDDLACGRFCGGAASTVHWMERDDILRGLEHFGFTDIRTGMEERLHMHGPCFAVVATRS